MAIRKLQLHKETLRRLTGKELSQVVGGRWGTCTRKPTRQACPPVETKTLMGPGV
jgi:hypothetical protein